MEGVLTQTHSHRIRRSAGGLLRRWGGEEPGFTNGDKPVTWLGQLLYYFVSFLPYTRLKQQNNALGVSPLIHAFLFLRYLYIPLLQPDSPCTSSLFCDRSFTAYKHWIITFRPKQSTIDGYALFLALNMKKYHFETKLPTPYHCYSVGPLISSYFRVPFKFSRRL